MSLGRHKNHLGDCWIRRFWAHHQIQYWSWGGVVHEFGFLKDIPGITKQRDYPRKCPFNHFQMEEYSVPKNSEARLSSLHFPSLVCLRATAIKVGKHLVSFKSNLHNFPAMRGLLSAELFCFNDPPIRFFFFFILFCCWKLMIITRKSRLLFEWLHLGNVPSPIPLPSRRELLQLH